MIFSNLIEESELYFCEKEYREKRKVIRKMSGFFIMFLLQNPVKP